MKILVAYDGTVHSKKALQYGMDKVRKEGGDLSVLQVFDRALFVDYDAGPRAEELARLEAARQLEEARRIAADRGIIPVRFIEKDGPAEEVIADHIDAEAPDLVLAPPRYSALVTRAKRPVRIIPGTILVPVDNSGALPDSAGAIAEEASASGSQVVLLGLIPVHLYSREEKAELARVAESTTAAVRSLRTALSQKGVSASEDIRTGYPDEEILKAAAEHHASLIILPSGGATPSELTKAAAILLAEPEQLRWPVVVLPSETAS